MACSMLKPMEVIIMMASSGGAAAGAALELADFRDGTTKGEEKSATEITFEYFMHIVHN